MAHSFHGWLNQTRAEMLSQLMLSLALFSLGRGHSQLVDEQFLSLPSFGLGFSGPLCGQLTLLVLMLRGLLTLGPDFHCHPLSAPRQGRALWNWCVTYPHCLTGLPSCPPCGCSSPSLSRHRKLESCLQCSTDEGGSFHLLKGWPCWVWPSGVLCHSYPHTVGVILLATA